MHFSKGQRLVKNMAPLFDGAVIEPCLLHGDLWSGNISSDRNGEPVILDPACYCKSLLLVDLIRVIFFIRDNLFLDSAFSFQLSIVYADIYVSLFIFFSW